MKERKIGAASMFIRAVPELSFDVNHTGNQSPVDIKHIPKMEFIHKIGHTIFSRVKLIFCSTPHTFNCLFAKFTGFVINFYKNYFLSSFQAVLSHTLHNNNVPIQVRAAYLQPPAGSHLICNNYFYICLISCKIGVNVYHSIYRIMGIIRSFCRTRFLNKVWNFLMFPKVLDPGLVLFSRNVIIGAMGSLTDSSKPFKLSSCESMLHIEVGDYADFFLYKTPRLCVQRFYFIL